MIRALLPSGLAVALASPAVAQPVSTMSGAQGYILAGAQATGQPTAGSHAWSRLRSELRALRRVGLALREADGGTLTPEHLAFIQQRIDAALAAYRPYRLASR